MSVQRHVRKKGVVYKARVYDSSRRSGYRERTFDRRTDAVAWEAQLHLAKRQGQLALLDAGKETLERFTSTWWTQYAEVHLAPKTLREYRRYLERDIIPALGRLELRSITPSVVSQWAGGLERGAPTVRKLLSVLQGILARAVEWGRLPANPVLAVRKPAAPRRHQVVVTGRDDVEALAGRLGGQSSLLVRLVAYAGLRPGEALALTWADVGDSTLSITKAVSLGAVRGTKTGSSRTIRGTDSPLWEGLRDRPEADTGCGLLLPGPDGEVWSETRYRNWRRRVFRPAARELGISDRPYDLRHTFASMLFAEQMHPVLIAEQMGHSLQTLLSTYVHEIRREG